MCEFCENGKVFSDEYDRYDAKITKVIPYPSVDLTTGEEDETADPPFYCLFIYEDVKDGELGSFPIEFCPFCGRKLGDANVEKR